jgi:hypothetical protein
VFAGGERAAITYTILGACRLAGVDPRAYLADVLPRLTGRIRLVDLPSLLPSRWAAQRAMATSVAVAAAASRVVALEVGFRVGCQRPRPKDVFSGLVRRVEFVDARNSPLGEFDGIDTANKRFVENKSATGVDKPNPATGRP